ncbi:nitrous oxide reductase accessory protein NosL [Natronobacterium gregoryi]|nr:nitrous oxide reductase accessory protein NosL [Natronobacterium gregoryi]AFZ73558.1 putative lipoprotein involved in nitrous oxide reduction [Natronobacterium gregoryi SP2]PLK20542.1 nitrous oxide reductase accessory protein NosL [Natronobacterium gregoryi SP2]SFJ17624.1 Nitrous oxide reductase accessory protein NosL [Natronobacterium gregoryi]
MESTAPGDRNGPTRRTLLAAVGGVGLATLAGCFSGDVPEPITIGDVQTCDQCTMEIGQHPGPVGQTHYADPEAVVDEDRPAQFCSSTCTYTHTFEQEDDGHDPQVVYLTDYSSVEYDVETDAGIEEISSHLEADAFATVDDLLLVVDSDVYGAMGPSMVGFADADEAETFQEEYGGDLYEHEDVTRELVMSLMG